MFYTHPPACSFLATSLNVPEKEKNVSSHVSETSQRGIVSTLTEKKPNLAPSTVILLVNAQAALTIVRHVLALVDNHMDIVRVVKGLRLVPDDGERGSGRRRL